MIVLDTHVWVWWAGEDARLSPTHAARIEAERASGIGVSAVSCWEVAKLVALGRLDLGLPTRAWLEEAVALPDCRLLPLSPRVAAESAALPGEFHRDPSDQIVVATARVWDCLLLTQDRKILDYPHVRALGP